jgi:hypothetical protein
MSVSQGRRGRKEGRYPVGPREGGEGRTKGRRGR